MPIVDIKLVSGSNGSWEVLGDHRYRLTWRTITDGIEDNIYDVLADPSFPVALGDVFYGWTYNAGTQTYDRDPLSYDVYSACVSIEPQQDEDNPHVWLFTVSYEGLSDPLATPADIDFTDTPYQEHTVEDCFGQLITNSALDPYEGGIVRDKNRSTLVISRPLAYDQWDPRKAEDYKNSLNQFPYTFGTLIVGDVPVTADPGTAKITSLTASRRIRTKNPSPALAKYYWQLRAVIDIDRSTFVNDSGVTQQTCWRSVKADAGFQERVLGMRRRIGTVNGNPSTSQLLDGNGQRLIFPSADPPVTLNQIAQSYDGRPIVNHGWYSCFASQTMNIPAPGVAASGQDIDTIAVGTTPASGTLTLNADGSFQYIASSTPGWYYFTFTATNEIGTSAAATVLLLVGPRPRIRIHEKYLRKDWSPLASWIGGW